jgi:hypothetical protein
LARTVSITMKSTSGALAGGVPRSVSAATTVPESCWRATGMDSSTTGSSSASRMGSHFCQRHIRAPSPRNTSATTGGASHICGLEGSMAHQRSSPIQVAAMARGCTQRPQRARNRGLQSRPAMRARPSSMGMVRAANHVRGAMPRAMMRKMPMARWTMATDMP